MAPPQGGEDLVDVGQGLQHGGRDQRRQADLTTGRQVSTLVMMMPATRGR